MGPDCIDTIDRKWVHKDWRWMDNIDRDTSPGWSIDVGSPISIMSFRDDWDGDWDMFSDDCRGMMMMHFTDWSIRSFMDDHGRGGVTGDGCGSWS